MADRQTIGKSFGSAESKRRQHNYYNGVDLHPGVCIEVKTKRSISSPELREIEKTEPMRFMQIDMIYDVDYHSY